MISIQQRGCVHPEVIQHEILHALGFHHEQSRSDRDKHVRIQANNVLPGALTLATVWVNIKIKLLVNNYYRKVSRNCMSITIMKPQLHALTPLLLNRKTEQLQ